MLPNRIALSQNATAKFRSMKQHTGLTPNILARVALMLAINEGSNLKNASVSDNEGQVLSRDVLFGDYAHIYELLINQYIHEHNLTEPIVDVICALIEIGAFKLGHAKKIQDLVF
jgi:DNA sulfur modification protein DndE